MFNKNNIHELQKCSPFKNSDPIRYYRRHCDEKGYYSVLYERKDCTGEKVSSIKDRDWGKCERIGEKTW